MTAASAGWKGGLAKWPGQPAATGKLLLGQDGKPLQSHISRTKPGPWPGRFPHSP
jgi:hypothetical protein